jgi:hypothetical protein
MITTRSVGSGLVPLRGLAAAEIGAQRLGLALAALLGSGAGPGRVRRRTVRGTVHGLGF